MITAESSSSKRPVSRITVVIRPYSLYFEKIMHNNDLPTLVIKHCFDELMTCSNDQHFYKLKKHANIITGSLTIILH